MQDPVDRFKTEELDAYPPSEFAVITQHLALEELEPIDMALGLAIAPWHHEGRPHRRQVGAQAFREPAHFRCVTTRETLQPSIAIPGASDRR